MDAGEVFPSEMDLLIRSSVQTGGKPVLPHGSTRKGVQAHLELVLVSNGAFVSHIRKLLGAQAGRESQVQRFCKELCADVVADGLGVLDDRSLVTLALDPFALCTVYIVLREAANHVGIARPWRKAIKRCRFLKVVSAAAVHEKGPILEEARARGWQPGQPLHRLIVEIVAEARALGWKLGKPFPRLRKTPPEQQ